MPRNTTILIQTCQKFAILAKECALICESLRGPCLDMTEDSFGNANSTCDSGVSNCAKNCDSIKTSCLHEKNYPLNLKFNSIVLFIFVIAAFLIEFAALVLAILWLADNTRRYAKPNILLGAILGSAAGIYATLEIHNNSLLPPLKSFETYNHPDLTAANYISVIVGIPLSTACATAGATLMNVATNKIKTCMLHAYNRTTNNVRVYTIDPELELMTPPNGVVRASQLRG